MKISAKKYAQALASALDSATTLSEQKKMLKQFVALLARRRALQQVDGIIRALEAHYNALDNAARATVSFARQPDAATQSLVRKTLAELMHVDDVAIDIEINTALLGGFRAKFPEAIIDASLKTKLTKLHQALAN